MLIMSERQSMNRFLSDDGDHDKNNFPPTYIVIRFAPFVKEETILWFVKKIKGSKSDGGADLLVRRQLFKAQEGVVLHISATNTKLLQMADSLELMKRDRLGILREFLISQIDEFVSDNVDMENFLTASEKQTLIRHELDNIRALSKDKNIFGYKAISLFEGKSIMQTLHDCGLIVQIYPLHDYEQLKKLKYKWLTSFTWQPFDEIREYFGESIALYFTFLGFYTTALLVPMFLGIIQYFMNFETLTYYCVFNVLWVIIFLEMWKRKSNELAFNWGTIGMTSLDEPQANFRGKIGIDPCTGKLLPQAPRWKTNVKMYCVSFPVVLVCLFGGFLLMLWSFWAEDQLKAAYGIDSTMVYIPGIAYTIIVYVLNLFYRKFATFLTEWENHRTQSQYDRHRVIKLVLFEFVNNFLALFYIAFLLQDMEMLKQQLALMLIVLQLINHLQEAFLPFVVQLLTCKISEWKDASKRKYSVLKNEEESLYPYLGAEIIPLEDDDYRVEQANAECMLDEYEGTYDDYLEMFIQFGYVILFSSVYPMAAFWAVLSNVIEIRTDAFKLCKTCQRPIARRVKNIGAWQRAFEILGGMSIMTNCALLWLSPQMRDLSTQLGLTDVEFVFVFVILEHVLIGARYILHQAIPDRPEWVRVALAKQNHTAKEALKRERASKAKKFMARHFSVYGTSQAL